MDSAATQGAAGTDLLIVSSHIRNNRATAASSKGGGLFFGAGFLDLLGVTFEDNEANSGDGIYFVTGTEVEPNSIVWFINDNSATGPY
jgi:hypothetical protein